MDVIDLDSSPSPGGDENEAVRVQPARAVKIARRSTPTPNKLLFSKTPAVIEAVRAEPEPVPSTTTSLISEWKEIEDQLRCDICKQLMDVPVSLKCFHAFCSFCIRRYLELSGNDYCPSCRIPATSTDIRLEPRLAMIISILGRDRGMVRKRMRESLKNSPSNFDQKSSKNVTLNKQADLADLFKATQASSQPVTRTLLPLYKNLKDKALRELIIEDGVHSLLENPSLGRDDLIRGHKEFIFSLQAAFDAVRMGMYPTHLPTKAGVAKIFNQEFRLRQRASAGLQKRAETDSSESLVELTRKAEVRMADQLRQAVAKRKALLVSRAENE